jgi:hypothetical protein
MLEYIIVFVIVGAAAVYVGRRLWFQIRGRGCEDCSCPEKEKQISRLIQIEDRRRRRL